MAFGFALANGFGRNPSGPVYDAEAAAYFTAAGVTDSAKKTAINDFIVGVKLDLTLTLLTDAFDQMHLQANESAAAAVVDMCGRLNHTLINNPTFTQWQGVAGSRSGAERYINMNFNPTTGNASKYTQNSHAFGFYNRTSNGAQNSIGAQDGSSVGRVIFPDAGGIFFFRDSNAGVAPSNAGGRTGLLSVSRTASNAVAGYKNGTSLATDTTGAATERNLAWVLCGANNNGSITGEVAESSFSFIGRGLTSGEMTLFNARLATLKTAIGW